MELTSRQKQIVEIVKGNAPITSKKIAGHLGLTRSAIRAELTMLTLAGILSAKPRVGYLYSESENLNDFKKSLDGIRVQDVCSVPVVVNESDSVYDGIVLMFLEDVGSLIVLSEGHLAGIVSRKDIIKASMGNMDMHAVPIGLIMTRMPNIYLSYPSDHIYNAAKRLVDHDIDSLPVVEKKNKDGAVVYDVIGRLTKTTITKLFVETLEKNSVGG